MKRFASITLGVVVALILVAAPASAGRVWCRADPIVRIGGIEYQVLISIPEENVSQVNGPLVFDVYSPRDTPQELIFMDAGFNGQGEKVEFREHDKSFVHTFAAKVSRTGGDFPALLEVYRDGELIASAVGTSNGVSTTVETVSGATEGETQTRLKLGEVEYDVVVTADEKFLGQVNGDLFFEVSSPNGAAQQLLSVEPGFNGFATQVEFRRHSDPGAHIVKLKLARSGGDFPLTVAVYRDGMLVSTATGLTNGFSFSIPK